MNIESLRKSISKNPLPWILLVAFAARLLAVFFAKGYMMHDDQFLTIEPAASWAQGKNFNDWLPGINNDRIHPEPSSFFYLGFLFVFFKLFQILGIENPEFQMLFMRFIHACYSLLIVYYAYKITEKISDKRNAIHAGMLLALIAILPNFSVRNLVEMVCIPPLLIGFWLLLKNANFQIPNTIIAKSKNLNFGIWNLTFIAAAFIMGLAVGLRYQTGLLVALVGLVLLLQQGFMAAAVFGFVSFFAFFLTQIDDVLLWGGQPFQHLQGYFQFNQTYSHLYPNSSVAYLSFVAYFIFPPVSLFLVFGFFKQWKKHLLLFLPVFGFLVFHCLYPNKQERFILPALPFVIILGVIGWNEFVAKSKFWNIHKMLLRSCHLFFWTINLLAMFVFCFTYSKEARVKAMSYLYQQGDCKNFVREATHENDVNMPPQTYSGSQWPIYYFWNKGDIVGDLIADFVAQEKLYENRLHKRPIPNYFLFYDDTNLQQRVQNVQSSIPNLIYQATIEAGWFDVMLHQLNNKNQLERIHIYKVV